MHMQQLIQHCKTFLFFFLYVFSCLLTIFTVFISIFLTIYNFLLVWLKFLFVLLRLHKILPTFEVRTRFFVLTIIEVIIISLLLVGLSLFRKKDAKVNPFPFLAMIVFFGSIPILVVENYFSLLSSLGNFGSFLCMNSVVFIGCSIYHELHSVLLNKRFTELISFLGLEEAYAKFEAKQNEINRNHRRISNLSSETEVCE